MKVFLLKAIFFTFFISTVLSLAFVLLFIYINKPEYRPDELHMDRNCLSGMEYGLPIALQLILMLTGFFSFLNIFKKFRLNIYLSGLAFFGVQLASLFWLGIELKFDMNFLLLGTLYVIYFIPWIYFYLKFRREFGNHLVNLH